MIIYEGFTKRFGRVEAVSDLDLEVRSGETLALIGPNGSGKSTTIKAALGLVGATGGRVLVGGADVATAGRRVRGRLGYLPQRLGFPEGFTARGAMRFYAGLRGVDPTQADALLDRVGLLPAADRRAEDFSGGMKQRLGIAVALLGGPEALILDEPTAALDPTGSLSVRDLVADIAGSGTTVLLSSHDLAEVTALADRIAFFVAGRLAAVGSAGELARALAIPASMRIALGAPAPGSISVAMGAGAAAARWEGGVLHCDVESGGESRILKALRAAGAAPTEISIHKPDLEDIYRIVTAPVTLRVA